MTAMTLRKISQDYHCHWAHSLYIICTVAAHVYLTETKVCNIAALAMATTTTTSSLTSWLLLLIHHNDWKILLHRIYEHNVAADFEDVRKHIT